MIPERTSIRSNSGTERRNSAYSSSVQKPITRSTPARLYQLRSNKTISPSAGRWATYLWKYHGVFSRSVGAGSATTRQTRGFRLSVMRLITPPLPAASRPSKITTTFRPLVRTHSWSLTSSTWSLRNSFAYDPLSTLMLIPIGLVSAAIFASEATSTSPLEDSFGMGAGSGVDFFLLFLSLPFLDILISSMDWDPSCTTLDVLIIHTI